MKAGWKATTLGAEIDLLAGFAFKSKAYTDAETDIRLLRGDNIVQGCLRWDDVKKWPATDIESYDRYQLQSGDVVLAMDRPWVKAGLKHAMMTANDLPCLLVQRTARLRVGSNLENRYLMYLLGSNAFTDHILGVQTGIGVPHISGQQIKDFEFTRPPLGEQQRIVGILDEAFEGIATAKANAEKNLQNARALFESHLQSVFTQRGEGWVEKTIEEVCVIGDGNHSSNYPRKDELVEAGIPFIRSTNMVAGRISASDMRFLSPEKHAQLKKGHLKTGDILITNRGEIGKTAIVDSAYDNANLNSQIAWLRCREGMDNRFLFHVLNSSQIQQHFDSAKSGAALQQFTIRQLKALRVPSPPMPKQDTIVEQLDALSEETQRLATIYERKLAALDDLKKSLLHQAFSGNL